MLGDISGLEKIYIVCGYTDMRKSIDGLCAMIEDQLKMDPASSALFLFCGRRRDRIKALFREPDGFVLIYKRLSVRGISMAKEAVGSQESFLAGVRLADVRN